MGKNSSIPNINGYRKQAVEYLKGLVPVLRWPGGCYADDYHWRDGIGSKRPKTVNLSWSNTIDDNSFGAHEFIGLCRLIGAQPYLAGNVGSGTPEELRDWMEYCNFPSGSSLADERAANGSPEPFNVKYWGVGNENWGGGGQMSGDEYAALYRRFTTYLRGFGSPIFLVACGPSTNDKNWTTKFWEHMPSTGPGRRGRVVDGFAIHYYSRGSSFATRFNQAAMEKQFASFADIERTIVEQRALIDNLDPAKRASLILDEWGVWDRISPEDEKQHGRLWQPITMRSAVAAGLGLNMIHRQADKLVMTNIAQMVNVLHSLLLTDNQNCVRTSTYYVYEMTKPHLSQTAVLSEVESGDPIGLSVSVSRQERDLVLTLVNPKADSGMAVHCSLAGGSATGATGRILHHSDLNAENTFTDPNRITPGDHKISIDNARISVELPPLSVVTATVRLA
ncbi:MAG: alpha-N-arabinofuranosidase [Bryobacteraceae bacterium]